MEKDPQILLVAPDRQVQTELASALAAVPDVRPVVSYQPDYRLGLEAARSRRPDLALVQMTSDINALKNFVEECNVASPATVVVAVFYGDVFGAELSESEVLIDVLRSGIRDFLRRPLAPDDVAKVLERLSRISNSAKPVTIGKMVAFCSNKGGVGKSSMSVNVATELAKRNPGNVLLIDGSMQVGTCANILDLEPATTIIDAARQRDRLDERLIRELTVQHPSGLHLLSCPNDAIEAAEVDDEVMSRVLQLSRRAYDMVVVDTFPMMDRIMTAILDLVDCAYVVTESTVPTIRATVKLLHLFDQLGIPPERRRLVLNRYSRFSGNLKPADVAARCGCAVDFVIPYEKKLLIAANLGRPFILDAGRFSSFARELRKLVDDVGERTASAPAPETAEAEPVESAETGQELDQDQYEEEQEQEEELEHAEEGEGQEYEEEGEYEEQEEGTEQEEEYEEEEQEEEQLEDDGTSHPRDYEQEVISGNGHQEE